MKQLKITKQITQRDSISLNQYLSEISQIGLISAEEEVVLAQRIKEGDQEALEKLTKANLKFVISVAKQYLNRGISLSDLINEGNLGLIKAAQRFDETRGFKFISFAVWWIRQSILQALAEQTRMVRLPLNKIGIITKVKRTSAEFEQEYERKASVEEIATISGLTQQEIKNALKQVQRHMSMDAPLSKDENDSISLGELLECEDSISPDESLISDSLRMEITRSLNTLTDKEADIIKLFYGICGQNVPHSLEEIANIYDLTRERVRQIKVTALEKLRNTSRCRNLKQYLG